MSSAILAKLSSAPHRVELLDLLAGAARPATRSNDVVRGASGGDRDGHVDRAVAVSVGRRPVAETAHRGREVDGRSRRTALQKLARRVDQRQQRIARFRDLDRSRIQLHRVRAYCGRERNAACRGSSRRGVRSSPCAAVRSATCEAVHRLQHERACIDASRSSSPSRSPRARRDERPSWQEAARWCSAASRSARARRRTYGWPRSAATTRATLACTSAQGCSWPARSSPRSGSRARPAPVTTSPRCAPARRPT